MTDSDEIRVGDRFECTCGPPGAVVVEGIEHLDHCRIVHACNGYKDTVPALFLRRLKRLPREDEKAAPFSLSGKAVSMDIKPNWLVGRGEPPALKPGDLITDAAQLKVGMRIELDWSSYPAGGGLAYKHYLVLSEYDAGNALWLSKCGMKWTIDQADCSNGHVTYLGGPDEARPPQMSSAIACGLHNCCSLLGHTGPHSWEAVEVTTTADPKTVQILWSCPRCGRLSNGKQQLCAPCDAIVCPTAPSEAKPSDPWEEHLRQEREIFARMTEEPFNDGLKDYAIINRHEVKEMRQACRDVTPLLTGMHAMACGMYRTRR